MIMKYCMFIYKYYGQVLWTKLNSFGKIKIHVRTQGLVLNFCHTCQIYTFSSHFFFLTDINFTKSKLPEHKQS